MVTIAPARARRVVVYAASTCGGTVGPHMILALEALRPHADHLIIVTSGEVDAVAHAELERHSDSLYHVDGGFNPSSYAGALDAAGVSLAEWDELLFTGDVWFGPTSDVSAVFDRMASNPADVWEMVENKAGPPRSFPDQGFSEAVEPWLWVLVRRRVFLSAAWRDYWEKRRDDSARRRQESEFATFFAGAGFTTAAAFPASDFGSDDPATLEPDVLIDAGCPIVRRTAFTLYPPYLHQQAVIGRDIVAAIRGTGYPMNALWSNLVRTVPPKALNTNAGMLEIIQHREGATPTSRRIAVVAHISDVDRASELIARLAALPDGYHLVVTASDGRKARAIQRMLEDTPAPGAASVDIRVSPSGRGRDMSDFFIASRDVILNDDFDLIVKVSARAMRRKTVNVRRYFRRYQLENLLADPSHVAGILELFDREPGLGLVFPPMMHIGYATMGKGWGGHRKFAEGVHRELGITVPMDVVTPLAPFGGMWIGRPEALRLLAEHPWQYRDYGKPGRKRYGDLAPLQERLVVAAAAQRGFHSRTVLAASHAAISHTALDFKNDQMFATLRGYPLDAILLLQRAGHTGYGGIVGLARMYLRLNHRLIARAVLPVLAATQWVYERTQALMGNERFVKPRDPWGDEDL